MSISEKEAAAAAAADEKRTDESNDGAIVLRFTPRLPRLPSNPSPSIITQANAKVREVAQVQIDITILSLSLSLSLSLRVRMASGCEHGRSEEVSMRPFWSIPTSSLSLSLSSSKIAEGAFKTILLRRIVSW